VRIRSCEVVVAAADGQTDLVDRAATLCWSSIFWSCIFTSLDSSQRLTCPRYHVNQHV